MKKFLIKFNGRMLCALGELDVYELEVVAKDETAAVFSLYEKYEHISVIGAVIEI